MQDLCIYLHLLNTKQKLLFMKQKQILFSFVLFMITFLGLHSQTRTLTGIVVDESQERLPGVNIIVKGTTQGTTTGFDGEFQITAREGATLVFSYLGFKTREVAGSSNMKVVLTEDSETLGEVTVVGSLGIVRNKKALPYATQALKGDEVAETQRTNFVNALQGRVAGLTVTSTSGQPGASSAVNLRGVTSMSGSNSPLYIVDGLPVSNQTLNQGLLISDQPNRNMDYSNRGADINPEDIESITILKGPEAAALYGIEAGNGAIIITTKKGKKGLGTVNFSSNFRVENVYRFPENQREYQRGDSGLNHTLGMQAFGTKFDPGTTLYDNVDSFFKTGYSETYNLSFEGGSETLTYRLGIADTDQSGTVPNTGYDRLNVTLNGTAQIKPYLRSEASFIYAKTSNQKGSKGAGSYLTNLLAWPINDDVTNYLNPDGTRRRITDNSATTEFDNPFWDVYNNLAEDENDRMVTNIGLIWDATPWLSFTGRVGYDVTAGNGYRSIHPQSNAGISQGGYIETYYNQANVTTTNLFATLKKSFGKFNTRLILGNAISENEQTILSTQGSKFLEQNFLSINNTDPTTQRSQERIIRKKVVGFYGEAVFDYDNILFLTLTGRKDWSSTLPEGDNDFFYPSVGTSFVFSEIGGLKDSKVLTLGKLRASYAEVGNDAKPYDIVPSYQPQPTTGGGFAYGVTGANAELKPEYRKSYELGTELQFYNNRLGLDVAVYRTKTEDQIIRNLRLSYGTGFVVSSYNYGDSQTEGLEITLNATPIRSDNFSWDFNVNYTKTESELLNLPPTLSEYYISDTWLYGNVRAGSKVGGSLTTFTGATYARNANGQVLVDPNSGYPIYDNTFQIIGDRNPDYMLGFQNAFNFYNFTFSFLLDFRKGGDVYNGNERYLWVNGYSARSLDREQPVVIDGVLRDGLENTDNPTKNNIQVTPFYQNGYYSAIPESDFIEKDIDWMRVRDITLSYRMPAKTMQQIGFLNALSLSLTVTDAYMKTNYTGADPAVNGLNASVGGAGGTGFDYGVLSTPRGINFAVRLGF